LDSTRYTAQWAKIRCHNTVGRKRSLHENNDCGCFRHDMDLRFDANESRL
jgi:hypothetical protein